MPTLPIALLSMNVVFLLCSGLCGSCCHHPGTRDRQVRVCVDLTAVHCRHGLYGVHHGESRAILYLPYIYGPISIIAL